MFATLRLSATYDTFDRDRKVLINLPLSLHPGVVSDAFDNYKVLKSPVLFHPKSICRKGTDSRTDGRLAQILDAFL